MKVELKVVVDLDVERYAEKIGIPTSESHSNIADEFLLISDGHSWRVVSSMAVSSQDDSLPDVVQTILARPRNGSGGGIPLTRGEVAMLFLDGHAGDGPGLLDIRSQGYGDDDQWDGLTRYETSKSKTPLPSGRKNRYDVCFVILQRVKAYLRSDLK